MAAYQEGSYDLAKRLTSDALAEDPQHAGARALRARIDARAASPGGRSAPLPGSNRAGTPSRGHTPEATSVDPTLLIDRADRRPPDHIEPTVLIQRDELPWQRNPTPTPAPSRHARPVSDPTVLIDPRKKDTPAPGSRSSSGGFFQRLGRGTRGPDTQPPAPRRPDAGRRPASRLPAGAGFWTPTTRGIVMAVAALAVAGLLVVGIVAAWGKMFPSENTLTIRKPEGGTITGAGLNCGTGGNDCKIERPVDSMVELRPEPDANHVFSGYTGDCPENGRIVLSQPKTCGATFDPAGPVVTGRLWPLTLTKPEGGTIIAAGGVLCGSGGDACTVNLPDGVPVNLQTEPDSGFRFVAFTGDCSLGGETTMTGARSCGATFAKTETPIATASGAPKPERPINPLPPVKPRPSGDSGSGQKPPAATANTTTDKQPPTAQPAQPPAGPPVVNPVEVKPVTPAGPKQEPTTPVDDEEAHAKKEIALLVRKYCEAFQTMRPERIKEVFPLAPVETLKAQFSSYKSLKCTITAPVEYDRITVKGSGGAQIKFGMKQEMAIKVGGQPAVAEHIVTMSVSRRDLQKPWLIDWVNVEPKPK
jgi:hypothetical protein